MFIIRTFIHAFPANGMVSFGRQYIVLLLKRYNSIKDNKQYQVLVSRDAKKCRNSQRIDYTALRMQLFESIPILFANKLFRAIHQHVTDKKVSKLTYNLLMSPQIRLKNSRLIGPKGDIFQNTYLINKGTVCSSN